MKGTRHSEEQIIAILKQGEAGLTTAELCRQHGISEQTYYRWKAKYGGMDSGEAKRLKQLEDENRKLKHVVAELTLDNRALKDVLSKTGSACGTSGSRELRRGRVPDERAARLQADGIGTNDASLSGAKSGAGQRTASALEKTSGEAHAFRVSAADGDAGAGRNADQPQARVPALPRGRLGDEDSATAADPLEGRGN